MDTNKLREEMAEIADSTCDVIDAVKKFINTMDNAKEMTPQAKTIMIEALKDSVVRLMFGEGAHVVRPYTSYAYTKRFRRNDPQEELKEAHIISTNTVDDEEEDEDV